MSNLLFPDMELEHDPGCKRHMRIPPGVTVQAEIDGPYRNSLSHIWSDVFTKVMWGMMNPSDAGLQYTDATVAKCSRLARRWGYGGIFVGNACAYRATDRMRLLEVADPVGPRNHAALLEMAAKSSLIIIAHGKLPGALQVHAHAMVRLLRDAGHKLHILRLSEDGTPVHPLARGKGFIPEDITPVEWSAQ